MNQIESALTRLYNQHRIVFWYDDKQALRAEFDALALPDVEKIVNGQLSQNALSQRACNRRSRDGIVLHNVI